MSWRLYRQGETSELWVDSANLPWSALGAASRDGYCSSSAQEVACGRSGALLFSSHSPELMHSIARLVQRPVIFALLVGCGRPEAVRIGDGYPRDESLPFLEAIRP